MYLRDDEKSKALIDYINQNKDKHRGLFTWSAQKGNVSYNHIMVIVRGNAPYNTNNTRLLRLIANRIHELDQELELNTVPLIPTVDTLPAA